CVTVSTSYFVFFFFIHATFTIDFYTLSLHDALPISGRVVLQMDQAASSYQSLLRHVRECSQNANLDRGFRLRARCHRQKAAPSLDRKSTRLNSSHGSISYAVFCLKKKKT